MAGWVVAEVTELRSLLGNPAVQKDPQLYLKAVQKVIASMTLGIDVSSLFSEMIKAGGTQNPVQKKLVYLYLENYAESNSDLALMTVNTLLKDFTDRNPILRGQALRALCSLRLPDITKYKTESLQIGMKDSSAYVRKTAVMGVLKLHHTQPDVVDKMNFVDILYQMLRDRDPQVVVNCIAALSEILASEGGMVVNTKIAHYLLNRLEDFNEWGQCQVLNLVTSYTPSGEEEIFDILNMVDDRFKHRNSGVVLGAIHLFIRFTQGLPQLQKDVYSRIHTPMLSFLCTDYIELLYTYLYHAQLLLANNSNMWRHDYKSFYCRYTDPVPIKLKKVEMLSEICMFESTRDIVSELSVYATDVNSMVACQSIKAVGTIALRIPSKANICIDQLISLLNLKVDYVTSEVVVVMKDILRKFEDMLEYVLPKLPTSLAEFTSSDRKSALLWILGEYGEFLPNTPYVLEEVVNGVSEEPSVEVKLELLSALTKMFFKRPPECQEMLGRLLDYCINDENDQDVRDRAMLYYRLLKANLQTAKKVVCGQPKIILYDDSTIARKSALLKEFNTLAVLFNKPSREFITQKTPYIMVNEESGSSGAESSFERIIRDDEPFDSDEWKRVRHDSFSSLNLNPEALISAGDFEKKWTELPTAKEIHLCLDSVPSSEEFTMTLNSQRILTMASSPPKNPVVKHFMYAQNASTNHFFLVEVNMSTESNMFSFLLKCENSKQATLFTKYFLQSLGLRGAPKNHLLEWNACSNIPIGMKDACGTFYNSQLHIGGGCTGNSKADSMIYAYSPDVDMWKVLPPCPLKWFGMAAWNEQLILVGGMEVEKADSQAITNKLAVWEKGKWVLDCLPPMETARVSPTVISHGSHLIVIGGKRGYLGCSVETLDAATMQWHRLSQIPITTFPHTTAVSHDKIYLLHQRSGKILQADVRTFLKQKMEGNADEQSDSSESVSSDSFDPDSSSIWTPITKPPVSPMQMTSIGGYIAVFSHGTSGEGHLAIHAFFPETNSWYKIGKFPVLIPKISCLTSPDKKLYVVGGDLISSQFSQKMYQAVMTISTRTTPQISR